MKVLVVEDDSIMRRYLVFLLKQFKCEIAAEASCGEEAVLLAEKVKPDFIFMDIVLDGEIDGIKAAELISEKSSVPIMFLSGYDLEFRISRASIPNMAGYLYKPVDEHSIRMALKKLSNYCAV